MTSNITWANSSLTTEHDGRTVNLSRGEAWAADDPFVRARPELFGDYAGPLRRTEQPKRRGMQVETAARRGPGPSTGRVQR